MTNTSSSEARVRLTRMGLYIHFAGDPRGHEQAGYLVGGFRGQWYEHELCVLWNWNSVTLIHGSGNRRAGSGVVCQSQSHNRLGHKC